MEKEQSKDKSKDTKNSNKKNTTQSKSKKFSGNVVIFFKAVKKEFNVGDKFETDNEQLYNYLIKENKIV